MLATAGGSPDWLLGPLRSLGAGRDGGPAGRAAALRGALGRAAALRRRAAGARPPEPRRLAGRGRGRGSHARVPARAAAALAGRLLLHRLRAAGASSTASNPYTHAPQDIPATPSSASPARRAQCRSTARCSRSPPTRSCPLGVAGASGRSRRWRRSPSLGVRGARVARRGAARRRPARARAARGAQPARARARGGGRPQRGAGGARHDGRRVLTVRGRAASGAGPWPPRRRPDQGFGGARRAVPRAGRAAPALAAAAAGARRGVGAAGARAAFGPDALDAFGLLGAEPGPQLALGLPYKVAELLAPVRPGDRPDYRARSASPSPRGALAAVAWLALRTWRGPTRCAWRAGPRSRCCVASAWLVPWYLLWLLPLAALAGDRRLTLAALALSAWMPWPSRGAGVARASIARVRADARGPRRARAALGPGDDAAVVRGGRRPGHLGRHGGGGRPLRARHPLAGDVGHKALATALSDLAAMGASAGEAYVALALPDGFPEESVRAIVEAMEALAARTGARHRGRRRGGLAHARGLRDRDRVGPGRGGPRVPRRRPAGRLRRRHGPAGRLGRRPPAPPGRWRRGSTPGPRGRCCCATGGPSRGSRPARRSPRRARAR